MAKAAVNVQGFIVSDCSHFVAEEQPWRLLAALIPFLKS
jgi:pimeloyl-ACP methyl ester carboxylesterase